MHGLAWQAGTSHSDIFDQLIASTKRTRICLNTDRGQLLEMQIEMASDAYETAIIIVLTRHCQLLR